MLEMDALKNTGESLRSGVAEHCSSKILLAVSQK